MTGLPISAAIRDRLLEALLSIVREAGTPQALTTSIVVVWS